MPRPRAPDPFALDGRVAVVTGGYGVLGGAIASGLAAAGAAVAILGRRRATAEERAKAIRESGGGGLSPLPGAPGGKETRAAPGAPLQARRRGGSLVYAARGGTTRARPAAPPRSA